MSDSIGKLAVHLTADVSQFSAGLTKGREEAKAFASEVPSLLESMKTGFGFGTGFFSFEGIKNAAQGIGHAILEMADAMDDLVDQASRLDIAVEDLEQIARWARLSDVGFHEATAGIDKMNRAIAEARDGSEKAAGAFEQLGLDPDELASASTLERLQRVAKALGEIQDAAERANLEFKLFGRAGTDLDELLGRMREGKTGSVVSEESAQALARLKDDWNELKERKGTWLTEQIGIVVDQTYKLFEGAQEASTVMNGIRLTASEEAELREAMARSQKQLNAELARTARWEEEIAAAEEYFGQVREAALKEIPRLQKELSEPPPTKYARAQQKLLEQFAWVLTDEEIASMETAFAELEQAEKAAKERRDAEREAAQLIRESRTEAQKYAEEIARISRLREAELLTPEQEARARDKARRALASSLPPESVQLPGLAERGSREEYAAIVAAQSRQAEAQARQIQLAEQEAEAMREAVRILSDMNRRDRGRALVDAGV